MPRRNRPRINHTRRSETEPVSDTSTDDMARSLVARGLATERILGPHGRPPRRDDDE